MEMAGHENLPRLKILFFDNAVVNGCALESQMMNIGMHDQIRHAAG